MMRSITVIDDKPYEVEELIGVLSSSGYKAKFVSAYSFNEIDLNTDLFVIDIHMPLIDGFKVADQIRTQVRFKDIPVLFLTNDSSEEVISKCLSYKRGDYVIKEASQGEFLARLAKLLLNSEGKNLNFGNIALNSLTASAYVDGKPIDLTLKEFKILLTIFNARRPLGRDELTKLVWGETAVTDKTLNSHLTNLRSKISKSNVSLSMTRDGRVNIYELH